jgi:hypothetical protein
MRTKLAPSFTLYVLALIAWAPAACCDPLPASGYYRVEAASDAQLLIQDTVYWSRLLCWKSPVAPLSNEAGSLLQAVPGAYLDCPVCGPWGGLYATDAEQRVRVLGGEVPSLSDFFSLWGCSAYGDEVMPRVPPTPFPLYIYRPSDDGEGPSFRRSRLKLRRGR